MASNSVDLTEEDAADLQFPKVEEVDYSSDFYDWLDVKPSCSASSTSFSDLLDSTINKRICVICKSNTRYCLCYDSNVTSEKTDFNCSYCTGVLAAPYIVCAECKEDIKLCCFCFANGAEFRKHKNSHGYFVMKNDFVLFEKSDWTAKEELVLLETLQNYGNWDLVVRSLSNRTAKEIKEHYNVFYLNRVGSDLFPVIPETHASLFPKPVIPYRFKVSDIEEPPRYAPNTVGYYFLAGYNAPRSDFEWEYDEGAEELVSNLTYDPVSKDDTNYEIVTNLQCCIVNSYQRRLKERQRRKKIVREHGLVIPRKALCSFRRLGVYQSLYGFNKRDADNLKVFMQFMNGFQFNFLMEGLRQAGELRLKIGRLCEFRKKGITSLEGARLYLKMSQMRSDSQRELRIYRSLPCLNWKNVVHHNKVFTPTMKRAASKPLDIVGLPGFDKLLPKEQDLCSKVRIIPEMYREMKEILINESKKMGSLKLQTARKMLKIDVNKTRKLYDFLIAEGFINKG